MNLAAKSPITKMYGGKVESKAKLEKARTDAEAITNERKRKADAVVAVDTDLVKAMRRKKKPITVGGMAAPAVLPGAGGGPNVEDPADADLEG